MKMKAKMVTRWTLSLLISTSRAKFFRAWPATRSNCTVRTSRLPHEIPRSVGRMKEYLMWVLSVSYDVNSRQWWTWVLQIRQDIPERITRIYRGWFLFVKLDRYVCLKEREVVFPWTERQGAVMTSRMTKRMGRARVMAVRMRIIIEGNRRRLGILLKRKTSLCRL